MVKAIKVNLEGKKIGEVELKQSVFCRENISEGAIYRAIVCENHNLRRGNHSTKNRVEVSGGGRKPWRQKGTGRARHGSIRSPIWVGGGVVFGPKPKNYHYEIPKKEKHAAMQSILTKKAQDGDIIVIDDLQSFDRYSTKTFDRFFGSLDIGKHQRAHLILAQNNRFVKKSVANLPKKRAIVANLLSARSALYNHKLIIEEKALDLLEQTFGVKDESRNTQK